MLLQRCASDHFGRLGCIGTYASVFSNGSFPWALFIRGSISVITTSQERFAICARERCEQHAKTRLTQLDKRPVADGIRTRAPLRVELSLTRFFFIFGTMWS